MRLSHICRGLKLSVEGVLVDRKRSKRLRFEKIPIRTAVHNGYIDIATVSHAGNESDGENRTLSCTAGKIEDQRARAAHILPVQFKSCRAAPPDRCGNRYLLSWCSRVCPGVVCTLHDFLHATTFKKNANPCQNPSRKLFNGFVTSAHAAGSGASSPVRVKLVGQNKAQPRIGCASHSLTKNNPRSSVQDSR
jgi:hypothetical protein